MMNCLRKTCLHNSGNMCGMVNDQLIGPDGMCQTYTPEYETDKRKLEGDLSSAIATGINRFKAQSGFSIAELSVEVTMTNTTDHSGAPETIIEEIRINTVILE